MKPDFRSQILRNLRKYAEDVALEKLVDSHGSPVLLLDPEHVRTQYRALQRALPMVKHYFAIKALRHPDAVAAVDDCKGYFDVMTVSDLELVEAQRIAPERCMFTNPIKRARELTRALAAGIRVFVVDNPAEVDKFTRHAGAVRLLVRLSFPNPEAKSDLSYKFGVTPSEAEELVAYATKKGLEVAGFTLHVGSQMPATEAYVKAITKTAALMDCVERAQGVRMRILDIGGGFPVDYLEPMPQLSDIADAIGPLLESLSERTEIYSEPGRFVVAPAMTLVTQVVGKSMRRGRPWYYLDDGLYGSYSNVIFENVRPPIVAFRELGAAKPLDLRPSALAGPTCDSVDVISPECLLPELEVGDYLVSPMMGAYTAVSATEFNGIPRTPIVTLGKGHRRPVGVAAKGGSAVANA